MLKNMKLGTMTIGGFAIVLILTAIVAYIGYNGLSGVTDRVDKADDVNRLVKDMLAARQQEKNFIIRGDKEYVDNVAEQVEAIRKQANETRAKFKDPANKQQMDEILTEIGNYEKAFAGYVELADRQRVADGKMAKAAKEILGAANVMQRSTEANDANRIANYTLDTLRQQKNFVIRGDNKYVNFVHKSVERIVKLAKRMKSRFEEAENKALAANIIAAAQEYKAAFDDFVILKGDQGDADLAMVAAARAGQKTCAETRADQKAKMEAQISTANKTLFGGAIVAILLGLGFALWIAKAISGGIGKVVGNIEQIADATVNGKLDTRADVEAVGIDFKAIPAGLNNVLDAVIAPLNVMAEYVDRISKGDIPAKITDDYKGDFNEVKNNLNVCIDAINGLTGEMGMLAEAAVGGKLDTRGDADKFGGDFGKIVQGTNATLDAVIAPLNVMAEYVDRISKGDIPEKITDEYKGDFNEVKNNLNQCIDAINGLTAEAGMLAEAVVEGKLDTRGDADKFGGDYAKIVKGVNDTLDAIVIPMNEAMDVLGRVADRDLTRSVVGNYKGQLAEFKENTNKAVKNLGDALTQAASAADQVGSASGQVASSSQSLAEGSAEQAASLEETSSSLEEMASMTKQNADNANQANNLMNEANQTVGKANDSMRELTTSMEEISKASEETSKIIKTIDEIAFQTNLLALNAAVEAARAGEAGAGFAVVAEEVRNLAMRSAEAAKSTAILIEGTVKKVNDGGEIVTRTNEAFTEVATSAGKVGQLVGEIAAASNEQAQGIEQVNKAVAEMDKVTQQSAANAEESASASEQMTAQAQELNSMLASFKLNGQGMERKQITIAAAKQHQGVNLKKVALAEKKSGHVKAAMRPEAVIPMKEDTSVGDEFRDF
ncbi:MAG: methyl-accepting chemotaxis protein [Desulfobacterales bacterium]|nr:methyl-accepting chemotaxis protein [Desulfobacterales bacterium]